MNGLIEKKKARGMGPRAHSPPEIRKSKHIQYST